MAILLQKNCLVCGHLFQKPVNCSLRDWQYRKYCSVPCKDKAPRSQKTILKMRLAKVGKPTWNKGKYLTEEHKNALRKKHKPISEENRMKMRGRRPWNKIGYGITPINERIRKSPDYKDWRKKVFERDDYTCQSCGKHGGNLNADHIKAFALFPELRFELSNGRTLCVPCHRKTETFGTNQYTNAA